jgi:hypothetical protein
MLTTNGYKTKTMYFCYIIMEIYVLVCTNMHSFIYFLCITIMPYHFHTMHFTHSQIMPKPLKNKLSTPFISLFHETFHSHNKLFSSNDNVFICLQMPQIPISLATRNKLNNFFSKIIIYAILNNESPCVSHAH